MAKTKFPKDEAEFGDFVLEVVKTLVALIGEKDPFLRKHSERVANNCANFCEEYKIVGDEDVETIYFAGLLHDIGIVAIPINLLQRTDPLTTQEMIQIKKHPVSGEKVLGTLSILKDVLPMVRHHHEAIDGSGYPDGLKADKIPLGARVIGLFNCLDTLVFARFSEKALSLEEALVEIRGKAGQLFDHRLYFPNNLGHHRRTDFPGFKLIEDLCEDNPHGVGFFFLQIICGVAGVGLGEGRL